MIIIVLFIEYKDISSDYYSADGKTLRRVTDSSPNLRISSKCEIIEDHCFEKSSSLQYFTFEENPNLTVIGKYSFNKCINLTIINLSSCSKLTKISNGAFSGCSSVVEVIFSEGLLEIQENAFYYAYKLTNIIIPASLEIIGEGAFDSCSKLKTVIFEEGSNLTSLVYRLFTNTLISSFRIPEKVINVSGYAFSNSKLTNLSIDDRNKHLIFVNNTVLSANKSILYFICNKTETFEIPEYVTTLGDHLFSFSDLKSITFPESLTTIGEFCFTFTKLTSIIIPENIIKINSNAFRLCKNLINVTFKSSLEIGSFIFSDCTDLDLIIFPNALMIVDAVFFISDTIPKLRMSFTNKTLFSSNSIKKSQIFPFHI